SKIKSGTLEFTNTFFDINELAQEVREVMQIVAKNQKIFIRGKIKKDVFADKNRIGQVFTNLLANAIKYSPNTKKIVIHLIPQEDVALIKVEDFGIGIDIEHKEKLFTRFYRVNNEYGKTFPGLGLGLYISNEIVKRCGGALSVESHRGKGSEFSFTLPYGPQG